MSVWSNIGRAAAAGGAAIAPANPLLGAALGIGGALASLFGGDDDGEARRKEQLLAEGQQMMSAAGSNTDSAMKYESQNKPNKQYQNQYDPFNDPQFLQNVLARYIRG